MATVVSGLGEGAFDYAVMFKSSGNLTATATVPSSGIKIRGTGIHGMAARVHFPSTTQTYNKVLIEVHGSVDDSTYRVISTYPGGYLSWAASTAKTVNIPFDLPPGYHYVKMKFTVAGGTTTAGAGFGAVQAGIVPRVEGEWSRTVRWD